MDNEMKDSLTALGLSPLESQVYLTLLAESPMTGYAVAQHSNVTRTRIYDILEVLVQKGFVTMGYKGSTVYSAIPSDICLAGYSARNHSSRRAVLELMQNYDAIRNNESEIVSVFDAKSIFDKLNQAITRTRHVIIMKLWACDLAVLKEPLLAAQSRGVELYLIVLGKHECNELPCFTYEHMSFDSHEDRLICASFDKADVLYGSISNNSNSFAALTKNICFRMLVNSNLVHEIRISRMYQENHDMLTEKYGEDLSLLRKKYSFNEEVPCIKMS